MALVNGIDDEDDEEKESNKFTLFPYTVHGGPPGGAPGRCASRHRLAESCAQEQNPGS